MAYIRKYEKPLMRVEKTSKSVAEKDRKRFSMDVVLSHGGSDMEEKRVAETSSQGFISKVQFFTAMEPCVVESSTCGIEKVHDQLQFTRAAMDEIRDENQRLKMRIDRIKREYEILQTKTFSIMQDETEWTQKNNKNRDIDELELVVLSLKMSPTTNEIGKSPNKAELENEELSLGLKNVFEGASLRPSERRGKMDEELNVVEAEETWPPSKVLKTKRPNEESQISQRNPSKNARVAVRARCETPTMNDGCQWRKYGQKTAKGNPCPRAYYRCNGSSTCPVKKQVQRCAEDMRILTTTYEGNHDHHLPPSATAMASTTSAAASMLLSASSISQSGSSFANLHGLNFHLLNTSNPRQSFSSPSSSSHPTTTIDLTSYNPLSFSQTYSSSCFDSGSRSNGVYNNNYQPGTLDYQTILQKNCSGTNATPSEQASPDTIAAATKAITADPSFQSALKAAISFIIDSDNSHGVAHKSKPFFPVSNPNESGFSSTLLSKAPLI